VDLCNSTPESLNGQSEEYPGIESLDDLVTIRDLAKTLGLDRSGMLKIVKKMGYDIVGRRSASTKSQLASAITREDALDLIERRKMGGFAGTSTPRSVLENGVFYVVQLVPELSERRVKLGFTTSVEERLQQHRTAAPTAILLKTWPCKRTWEVAAMDSITREGCNLILNEVFDCDDVAALIALGDAFFALMPELT
jgi:hypothetical protein